MAKKYVINQSLVNKENIEAVLKICPFGGLEEKNGALDFTAGCRSCGLCFRKGPKGLINEVIEEDNKPKFDTSIWRGVSVFIEHELGVINPVSFELIGKAKELAKIINQPTYAILIVGEEDKDKFAKEIISYGVDFLFIYAAPYLKNFNLELYSNCLEDFIKAYKPNTILYGGTPLGRSLAPRLAARFHTGLTADCTKLGMKENGDLIQVRPAFGGNIMAQIITPNSRPQMATVRSKIFKMPLKEKVQGKIIFMDINKVKKNTLTNLVSSKIKDKSIDISEASIIVACGRGFQNKEDLVLAENLATLLNGTIAVTRPLVEEGFKDNKYQIGLSGRTVAPKLIITLGISGAVQFTSGMSGSETIIAINKDPHAPIFNIAHYALIGDIYEILPKLIDKIKQNKGII